MMNSSVSNIQADYLRITRERDDSRLCVIDLVWSQRVAVSTGPCEIQDVKVADEIPAVDHFGDGLSPFDATHWLLL